MRSCGSSTLMTMSRTVLSSAALLALAPVVSGHAMMVIPRPRNSIEGTIFPWNGSVPEFEPVSGANESMSTWCPIASGKGHGAEDNALSGVAGQACFWFSNGCSIGCPKCMPTNKMCPGPSSAGKNTDFCGNGMKPTLPHAFRTYNLGAKSGSKEDRWMSTPWRAPGTAPVLDACGMAGGTPSRSHSGAQISPTPWFKQGDLGTKKLPAFPSGETWVAGGEAEVSWAINANHGGGYSYRLCPKSEPLSEACFQKTPLQFVNGSGTLRWDGPKGTSENTAWTYLRTGTHPAGSSWAKNPIPRQNVFPAPCKESPGCKGSNGLRTDCRCSGMWGPYNLEIVDKVKVPKVPAGDYVVGWRWDCEESAQVWSSCADITIKPGGYGGLGRAKGGDITAKEQQQAAKKQ